MPSTPRRTCALILAATATACCALVGCGGDDGGGDTTAFCNEVAANQELLFATPIDSLETARALVEAYRSAGEVAPLAIDAEWQEWTDLYDSFVTGSVPYDDSDVAPVYAGQSAALGIRDWLSENCSIDITVATVPDPLPQPDATEPLATG